MKNRLFVPKYFAGAFCGDGFKNHLPHIISDMKKIYIIKGTAGSGKSTLMKKVAAAIEENGYDVEYVYCSSDPESLDGIVSPPLSFAMVDGTAPHIIEAAYPLAVETIINTGDFIKHKEIDLHCNEIIKLSNKKKELFRNAEKLLKSACELKRLFYRITESCYNRKKGFDFCQKAIARERKLQTEFFHRERECGILFSQEEKNEPNYNGAYEKNSFITERSLFAFGKNGVSVLNSHPTAKIITVNQVFSPFILGTIKLLASEYKTYCICANDPIDINQTGMVHFPFSNTSFVNSILFHCGSYNKKSVSLGKSRFSLENALKENKEKLSFLQKTEKLILKEAEAYLEEAMLCHKSLEKIYVSSLNKDGLNCLAQSLIISVLDK